uniref:RNA-directed RNA polymerase n=1 Tax=Riboviria sp. TaxID=2585031 RepID=A0A893A7G9_9VIRU|nr:MAG: hypothetical protein 1 [Riboviria sp.]
MTPLSNDSASADVFPIVSVDTRSLTSNTTCLSEVNSYGAHALRRSIRFGRTLDTELLTHNPKFDQIRSQLCDTDIAFKRCTQKDYHIYVSLRIKSKPGHKGKVYMFDVHNYQDFQYKVHDFVGHDGFICYTTSSKYSNAFFIDTESAKNMFFDSSFKCGKLRIVEAEVLITEQRKRGIPSLLLCARRSAYEAQLQSGTTFFPQVIVDTDLQDKIEDAVILLMGLMSSDSWTNRAAIVLMALKKHNVSLSGDDISHMLKTIREWFVSSPLQSGDDSEDFTPFSEKASSFWRHVSKSDFAQGLGKILVFLLSLFNFGVKGNLKYFMSTIKYSGAAAIFDGGDMLLGVLKGFELVLTRVSQFYSTGRWDTLFHSESTYAKFDEMCRQVKVDYIKLRRHDPCINKHDLLVTIRDLIQQANNMISMASRLKLKDKAVVEVFSHLIELERLNSEISVKIDAQKPRETPYGMIVCGQSSVGKTSFLNCVHMYKEHLRGRKNASPQDIYIRNPEDAYWTNHDSTKTTIVVDDAANVRPQRVVGVDKTMNEIIFIVNCVQAMPPYADLADKGQNPLMNDLAVFSTNVENLNIPLYFNCPLAVARRLPVKIELSVRPEFRVPGSHMLNSELVPDVSYPDVWCIKVSKCKVRPGEEELMCQNFVYETVGEFTLPQFLAWFKKDVTQHKKNQAGMIKSIESLAIVEFCPECDLPSNLCDCQVEVQAGEESNTLLDALKVLAVYHGFTFARGWVEMAVAQAAGLTTVTLAELVTHVLVALVSQGMVMAAGVALVIVNRDEILTSAVTICKDFVVAKIASTFTETREAATGSIAELGRKVHSLLGGTNKALLVLGLVTAAIGARIIYNQASSGDQADMIGFKPVSKNERESVWKKDEYPLSNFDIPRQTGSLRTLGFDEQVNFLARNICHNNAQSIADPTRGVVSSMLCIKGNVFIGCGHTIPEKRSQNMKMVWQEGTKGVTANHDVNFDSTARRKVNTDLYTYFITDAQPRKSCEELFMPRVFSSKGKKFDGVLVGRDKDGRVYTNMVYECEFKKTSFDGETFDSWVPARCERKTVRGDCGSVLLLFTHSGPMIAGFHRLLFENFFSWHIAITACHREDLPDLSGVVGRGDPKLDSPSSRFGELQALHPNSHVRFIESDLRAEVFGSFNVWRSEHRSKMRKTVFYDDLVAQGIDPQMLPAVMSGWKADQRNLKKLTTNNVQINEVILRAAGEAMLKSWEPALPFAREEMMIYDVNSSLNGVAGLRFVDRMNFSSSAGWPYCTSKKAFLIPDPTDDDEHRVRVTDEIMSDVEHILDEYAKNNTSCTIFQYAKKDEMRPIQKVLDENTRGINGGQFGFTIVMRQLTLAMTRIMQLNPDIFNLCVGLEAQTAQWSELLARLKRKGFSKWVAIDFTGFDSSFMTKCMKEAFRVVLAFMDKSGATEQHKKYFKCMSYDLMYYMVNFCGTLMQLCGKNPSGHAWTVIINSIVNELYMRYAYIILHPKFDEEMEFDKLLDIALGFDFDVALATYGDDSFKSVSEGCEWYNHTAIKDAMAKFGVTVTMADKTSESRPYITQDEVSFLKRKFVFNSDFGKHVAPLEPMSIYKSLCWNRLSSVDSPAETLASCVMSATYEWAWHGREKYNEEMTRLHALCDKYDIKYTKIPFEFFVEKFKSDSAAFYADMEKRGKTFEQSAVCDYMPTYYHPEMRSIIRNKGPCTFYTTSCEFNVWEQLGFDIGVFFSFCVIYTTLFFYLMFKYNTSWRSFPVFAFDASAFLQIVVHLAFHSAKFRVQHYLVLWFMWRRLVSRRR